MKLGGGEVAQERSGTGGEDRGQELRRARQRPRQCVHAAVLAVKDPAPHALADRAVAQARLVQLLDREQVVLAAREPTQVQIDGVCLG